jgi:predicted nucleic acid-binding protein
MAIARYFEGSLPSKADRAFKEAEEGMAEILVPEIVVGEFINITLKGRLKKERVSERRTVIRELLDEMETSSYLKPIRMTAVAWNHFLESPVPELHGRMIHSIAMSLDSTQSVAIITNDPNLKEVFKTVW